VKLKIKQLKQEIMNRIKIESIGNFFELVQAMEVNTYYELPENCRYKWIKIDKGSEYYSKETYYCWAMEYNYEVTGSVGYIYPIIGNNKVAHFKTERGAKTSLIKHLTIESTNDKLPTAPAILQSKC